MANPFRITNLAFLQQSNPALYSRLAGNTFFTSATIQRNRLLRAFPQNSVGNNGLTYNNLPLGVVKVHSLEIQLNRRFANGFSGAFSYAANSVRENRIVNEFDRAPTIWQGKQRRSPVSVDRERRV